MQRLQIPEDLSHPHSHPQEHCIVSIHVFIRHQSARKCVSIDMIEIIRKGKKFDLWTSGGGYRLYWKPKNFIDHQLFQFEEVLIALDNTIEFWHSKHKFERLKMKIPIHRPVRCLSYPLQGFRGQNLFSFSNDLNHANRCAFMCRLLAYENLDWNYAVIECYLHRSGIEIHRKSRFSRLRKLSMAIAEYTKWKSNSNCI